MLAQAKSELLRTPNEIRLFQREIQFEGEPFGAIRVQWSTREGQAIIDSNVWETQVSTIVGVVALSGLFLFLTHTLAMRPLQQIHERMSCAISGTRYTAKRIPWYVSREFRALEFSVGVLEETFDERDEREHALEDARKNSDIANRTKSEFLANMSHEIRTPMNGVIGMAELILETELDDDQVIYAETIAKSGSALLTIINDILNFSKIEAGKMELEPAPFNLQTALEDVVTLLSPKAVEKGVEVTLRYAPELPTMFEGDVGRIRQIVTNVAGNAVKFTLDGYVYIDVNGRNSGDTTYLQISVTDTGIGIPNDQISKVFNEFEQVDSAATRKFEGTGLGLAISTRLMRLMGGKISATSVPDEGSVFTISLPLPNTDVFEDRSPTEPIDMAGLNVLVVDDLALNRHILNERLSSWGVQVTLAESGPAALRCLEVEDAEGNGFDLVIQDYQMPEMDGKELAERIRAHPKYATLPLIILSSVEQPMDLKTRQEIGQCELILKPIRSTQLRTVISRALSLGRQPVEKTTEEVEPLTELGRINILIAEDNKTNQLVVKTMLKKTPANIIFTENGLETIERYKEKAPDVILMDMSMPVMDGMEATYHIRQIEDEGGLRHCPIIALTANAMASDRERCINVGMDDFLSKPIGKAALIEALQRWSVKDVGRDRESGVA
jgi:signal transduction histidine kinase/CheY-like chemotaxis protein